MIKQTNCKVPIDTVTDIHQEILKRSLTGKTVVNMPTGRFFYDPWVIKPEFKNTAISRALSELPPNIGEARIIEMSGGSTYIRHSDIDDRYHLNITGISSYLIDVNNEKMYSTTADGVWYTMNAGPIHVAANFGNRIRYQLVVRHLLNDSELSDPVNVCLRAVINDKDEARYIFDNLLSSWLNTANKNRYISNFNYTNTDVEFTCEKHIIPQLTSLVPKGIFEILY